MFQCFSCFRIVSGDDDEEVFSNVEPEVVPTEVRDWLAMTFTRSNANATKRKVSDIPKFRSVAHVIRAGILVDRFVALKQYSRDNSKTYKNIILLSNCNKACIGLQCISESP